MKCPYCKKEKCKKNGIRTRKGGPVMQEWRCNVCNRYFITDLGGEYKGYHVEWNDVEMAILAQYSSSSKSAYGLYNELKNSGSERSFTEVRDKLISLGLKKSGYATGYELRLGYLDIETTGLVANVDIMLSWCIKERDKNRVRGDFSRRHEVFERKYDQRICKSLCDAMKDFDLIFTFYGTQFDVPFTRTRCIDWGLDYPLYRQVSHKDIYYVAKKALKLHRKSLDALCQFLGIEGKTHFDPRLWRDARYGHPASIASIYSHNRQDVIILEKAHKELEKYVPSTVQPL